MPLGIYAVMTVVSTGLSGGACRLLFLLLAVVGVFQLFKMDLLNFTWVQRLVMSAEQFGTYAGEIENVFTGNNVYLTLFNPNYAGIFLVMLVCVFGVMFYSDKEKDFFRYIDGIGIYLHVVHIFTCHFSRTVHRNCRIPVFIKRKD